VSISTCGTARTAAGPRYLGAANPGPPTSRFQDETAPPSGYVLTRRQRQGRDVVSRHGQAERVDLEGACRGSLACAPCHLILTPEWYARLPPAAASEQLLLDVAFGMTTTSRLGCQLTITQDLDGCVAHIADRNRDLALSPLT